MSNNNTQTYEELAMFVGNDVANIIVSEYRGQELYVPAVHKLSERHKLVILLGWDNARRLCQYYAKQPITIPMQQAKRLSERNAEMVEKHEAGVSKSTLAREYGLHVRRVRKIIETHYQKKAEEAYKRNQLELF